MIIMNLIKVDTRTHIRTHYMCSNAACVRVQFAFMLTMPMMTMMMMLVLIVNHFIA